MGRHPRNAETEDEELNETEESGSTEEAKKLPNKRECSEAISKLQKLDSEKADLAARIKGVYDNWANKGYDRTDLKGAYKEIKKARSIDQKHGINFILNQLGQGDLFAFADAKAAEAA